MLFLPVFAQHSLSLRKQTPIIIIIITLGILQLLKPYSSHKLSLSRQLFIAPRHLYCLLGGPHLTLAHTRSASHLRCKSWTSQNADKYTTATVHIKHVRTYIVWKQSFHPSDQLDYSLKASRLIIWGAIKLANTENILVAPWVFFCMAYYVRIAV